VNDRMGLPGDFATAEQHLSHGDRTRPWEACITAAERHWGHHAGERLIKRPEQVVHLLAQAAEGGGNLLLNVGPKADGSLPQPCVGLLEDVGRWMGRNGAALIWRLAGRV